MARHRLGSRSMSGNWSKKNAQSANARVERPKILAGFALGSHWFALGSHWFALGSHWFALGSHWARARLGAMPFT